MSSKHENKILLKVLDFHTLITKKNGIYDIMNCKKLNKSFKKS